MFLEDFDDHNYRPIIKINTPKTIDLCIITN